MPANKFVAGFIGTPQMNFFEGTLKKMGEEVEVKFNGSDSVVKIPYGMLVKVMPQYLDGKTPVYIGLRADDITIDPDDVKESSTTIKVKISHTEELGTETLVYGDIDMSRDSFGESPTQIILKAAGFKISAAEMSSTRRSRWVMSTCSIRRRKRAFCPVFLSITISIAR